MNQESWISSKAVLCTTRPTGGKGSTTHNMRRKSLWEQPETKHSTASLLTTMERFVKSVDDMNETILVPCRLMDLYFDEASLPVTDRTVSHIAVGAGDVVLNGASNSKILSNLNGLDLFQFFSVLNNVKNDLMWGKKPIQSQIPVGPMMPPLSTSSSATSVISTISSAMTTSTVSNSSSSNSTASLSQVPKSEGHVKGHVRRPSTVSTTSSTSASDTEFSELNEDSGVEAEHEDDCGQGQAQSVANAFLHHLTGLQQCLCDLTIAADYVTNRYTNSVGGGL